MRTENVESTACDDASDLVGVEGSQLKLAIRSIIGRILIAWFKRVERCVGQTSLHEADPQAGVTG
jgi:hypothetical protein